MQLNYMFLYFSYMDICMRACVCDILCMLHYSTAFVIILPIASFILFALFVFFTLCFVTCKNNEEMMICHNILYYKSIEMEVCRPIFNLFCTNFTHVLLEMNAFPLFYNTLGFADQGESNSMETNSPIQLH